MDVTDDRGYPYPQCDPPLTKDVSDAPTQTRLLAETMDADFDSVDTLINDTYHLPSTIITMVGPTAVASGSAIPFDNTEYDADGWATLPGITVTDSGLYLVTLFAEDGATAGSLMLQFTRNGSGFYLQGTSPAAIAFGRTTANGVTVLQSGDVLGARLTYIGAASSFQNARLSATKMRSF